MSEEEISWPEYGRWLKPEQEARAAAWLREKYGGGASVRAIADQIGKSYGFVHKALSKAGVPLRPRGGARPPRPK